MTQQQQLEKHLEKMGLRYCTEWLYGSLAKDAHDHALALLIDVLQQITAADQFVCGSWLAKGEYPYGSKVSSFLVEAGQGTKYGVGERTIGSSITKRLAAQGCIISYTSRSKKPTIPFAHIKNVLDLASNSDDLIICCPLTQLETHHIISEEVMRALGMEGVIVNVDREALIDEEPMVELLVRGKY
ncbi:glyoxylate/hydroxypyruvate reductase HPR3-like [Punica granatum]|uniref:Glyoxylate/hydroxypyruvate reductase HPR3-like n=1 Tax=Punica granatum TaxID=22663 RepID=A0A6P8DEW8_PUNGR|nr:glyoxylate/hydroxypyruvate reductase HPR3-like [Punica granatum]